MEEMLLAAVSHNLLVTAYGMEQSEVMYMQIFKMPRKIKATNCKCLDNQ